MKANSIEDFTKALELAKRAGLVTESDLVAAHKVKAKHGGEIAKILVVAGKIDQLTLDAANTCNKLIIRQQVASRSGHYGSALLPAHACTF